MKKRSILIIILSVVCIALAVVLFIFAKNKPVKPATTAAQSNAVETTSENTPKVADISLALSEYRAFLEWKAAEGAAGYTVYYDSGDGWKVYGDAKTNAFRSKGLKGGTSYTFGIKSYTMEGKQKEESTDFLYTIKGNTLPDTPQIKVTKKNNIYTVNWEKVNNANEYIVYSMLPGEKAWTREGITEQLGFEFEKKKTPKLFLAVRAVRYADGEKFVSDYVKTYVSDEKPAGEMYSYGDSIATGVGSHSYSYANIFAEENNLTLINKATTGSQLSSGDKTKDHICENIIKEVSGKSRYIFIEGGNNDYYFGGKLGKVTPDGTKDFDMNTTCGALEAALTHLKEKCPDTKVIFILIHNAGGRATTKNGIGLTFNDYANSIRAVCKKYGVPIADCLNNSAFNTEDTALSDKYTHKFNGVFPTGDGVHPTEEAYREFYMPLINLIK